MIRTITTCDSNTCPDVDALLTTYETADAEYAGACSHFGEGSEEAQAADAAMDAAREDIEAHRLAHGTPPTITDTQDGGSLGKPDFLFAGGCFWTHGTAEKPIWFLFNVPLQPIAELPPTCTCGRPFHYADAIAFVAYRGRDVFVEGTTSEVANQFVDAFIESHAEITAEDRARQDRYGLPEEE